MYVNKNTPEDNGRLKEEGDPTGPNRDVGPAGPTRSRGPWPAGPAQSGGGSVPPSDQGFQDYKYTPLGSDFGSWTPPYDAKEQRRQRDISQRAEGRC